MTAAITIERTREYSLLQRIVTAERIFERTADDFSPAPSEWLIPDREGLIYLLARDGNQILGFCVFVPVNGVTYEVHVCFLRIAYGEKALASFARMLGWMWGATETQRIIGAVPEYNAAAIHFARRAGFEVFGVNQKSWLKHGRLHDQVMLGISRPENL